METELGRLLPQGERLRLDNNRPITGDDQQVFYYVEKGSVNLFIVHVLADGSNGSRFHFCTVSEGGIFFTMFHLDYERILCIGSQDTVVRKYPIEELEKLASVASTAMVVDKTLSAWLSTAMQLITQGTLLGSDSSTLQANVEVSLKEGDTVIAPRDTVLWVRNSPDLSYFGNDWGTDMMIPLTSSLWVRALGEISFTPVDTGKVSGLSALLSAFHAQCGELLLLKRDIRQTDEELRINRKFENDQAYYDQKLRHISSLFGSKKDYSEEKASNSLVRAFGIVARSSGCAFSLQKGKRYPNDLQGLDSLAQDNHIRTRRVTLEDDWYRNDVGNLCGFLSVGDLLEPVALVRNHGRYVMIMGKDGTKHPVNGKINPSIQRQAWMLYRSLPDHKLSLKDIFRFSFTGVRRELILYLVISMAIAFLGMFLPKMTQIFYDQLIPQARKSQMIGITMLLAVSALVTTLFTLTRNFAMLRVQMKSGDALQAAVWDRMLKLPADFFRKFNSGELAARSLYITKIDQLLFGTLASSLVSGVFAFVYLAQMYQFSKVLAPMGLLLSLVIVAIMVVFCVMSSKHTKVALKLETSLYGLVLQLIDGVSKLKITSSEERAFGVWEDKFSEKEGENYKAALVNNVLSSINVVFPLIALMIFYFQFPKLTATASVSAGTFIAFLSCYSMFQSALLNLASAMTSIIPVLPMYQECKPILEAIPEVTTTKKTVSKLEGDIEVRHVDFRYAAGSPLVLKDVSLHVHPGEFVAIVGGSGSGKSTLLRLLLGFEHAENGTIYYDHQDLEDLDITTVRRQMGVVLQTSSLMPGSFFSNIVGTSNCTLEDAWKAAEMVGLADDIKGMPMNMQTMVQAGGQGISGGQRQRLIIARAIIKRPPILFFDEASSALDNKTQAIVSHSLENLHVTRIVIAHRLSTIQGADHIYVLQNGVIQEDGTYQELMEKKQFFYQLANRQTI